MNSSSEDKEKTDRHDGTEKVMAVADKLLVLVSTTTTTTKIRLLALS